MCLSLADRHYPNALCKRYAFDRETRRWQRTHLSLREGTAPPVIGPQEVARALTSSEALPCFLMDVGAWVATRGRVAPMVCRDTFALTDAMATQKVPPANLGGVIGLYIAGPISQAGQAALWS